MGSVCQHEKSTSISSFRSHIFLEREVTTHSSRPPSINIAPVRWVFTYHRISATRGTWQHTVRMSLSVLCYMRCAVVFEAPAQFLPLLFFSGFFIFFHSQPPVWETQLLKRPGHFGTVRRWRRKHHRHSVVVQCQHRHGAVTQVQQQSHTGETQIDKHLWW